MAEMKDMKLSPKEQKELSEPTSMVDKPEYPWGLQLSINDEEYEKLFSSPPQIGEVFMVQAKAKVTGINLSNREDGEDRKNVQLQIIEMGLEKEAPKKEASEAMYGKG